MEMTEILSIRNFETSTHARASWGLLTKCAPIRAIARSTRACVMAFFLRSGNDEETRSKMWGENAAGNSVPSCRALEYPESQVHAMQESRWIEHGT